VRQRSGSTHFVDDRLEVLSYLAGVPNRYLFATGPDEVEGTSTSFPRHPGVDWPSPVPLLLG
jgi:hypothetical protein